MRKLFKDLKKTFIICFLLLFLIVSCGLVSAASDVDDNILSADNINDADISESSQTVDLNMENGGDFNMENVEDSSYFNKLNERTKPVYKDSITVNGDTFEDIQKAIDNANSGDTIELNGTYSGNGTPIIINKTIKINGNGHILSGEFFSTESIYVYYSSILNITNNSSVDINNVTFRNAYGAIYNEGKLNISYSKFEENGGETINSNIEFSSIYSLNELYLNNCEFSKNMYSYNDVYSDGFSLINNCIFKEDYFFMDGAGSGEMEVGTCLNLAGKGSISNCEFINNEAELINTYIPINNCKFFNNTVYNNPLIKLYNTQIYDSLFTNNDLKFFWWNDPYFRISVSTIKVYGDGIISNCTIINSTSQNHGAAISVNDFEIYERPETYGEEKNLIKNVLIEDCAFIDCYSKESGGAISINSYKNYYNYYYDYDVYKYIPNGTVYSYSNVTILNCSFLNNNAKYYGGAIYIPKDINGMYSICSVINSSFESNKAQKGDDIYNMGNLTLSNNQYTHLASIYNANYYNGSMINSPLTLKIVLDKSALNIDNSSMPIYAILLDEDNNPIEDDAIELTIGNETKTLLFNEKYSFFNGSIKYTDEPLAISGSYNGTNNLTVQVVYLTTNDSSEKTTLTVNGNISFTSNNNTVIIILKDNDNKVIPNAKLNVQLNDNEFSLTTDSNGQATIKVNGNSTIIASYQDENNLTATGYMNYIIINNVTEKIVEKNITVYVNVTPNRTATKINYNNMTTTAVAKEDGRIGEYFKASLFDAEGKALANKTVYIGFNGKSYIRQTNQTGGVELQINLGYEGKYTFAVAFLGDDDYNGFFEVALITVNKHSPKLTAPSKTFKAKAKTKTVTATFKTANGNAISNKKISFKINGKTYTGTTNTNGVASVKISLNKKGTYTATSKYAGDGMYKETSTEFKVKIV